MLHRRNSTDPIPGPASPRPRSDSFSDRRPLNLVTNQQPFGASTARTLETDSPQSETSPQEIPPIPPRPPANSGLRRRSTRRGTYEIYDSAPVPPAPGDGVGGFAAAHHASSRYSSHLNKTAGYTYLFDAMPSSRSNSGPPHYESADISGGIHANIWPTYNKISREFDEKRLMKWTTDLDVLAIFVSVVAWGVY